MHLVFYNKLRTMKKLILIISGILTLSLLSAQNFTPLQELLPKSNEVYTNIKFGASVAVYGNYAVVGAKGYNNNRGRVYIYKYSNAEWKLLSTLKSPDDRKNGCFGHYVDINNNFIAVSALDENGVGTVFLFERIGAEWSTMPVKVITLNSVTGYSHLGDVLCLSNSDLVISSVKSATTSKSIFIYSFNGLVWSSNPVIKDTDIHAESNLGKGSYVAVNSAEVFVGGKDKVVVYKAENTWVNTSKTEIVNPDIRPDSEFGNAIAVDNNTLVIGDMTKDTDGVTDLGVAYLYTKDSDVWSAEPVLLKPEVTDGDNLRLGKSVTISGNRVVVGAANPDGLANDKGSLFIFYKGSGSEWTGKTQDQVIVSEEENNVSQFGWSVDLFGDKLITGAPDINNTNNSYIRFHYNIDVNFIELPGDDLEAKPYYYSNNSAFGYCLDTQGNYVAVGRRTDIESEMYPSVDIFKEDNHKFNYKATLICKVTGISDKMFDICYEENFVALSAGANVYIFNKDAEDWSDTDVSNVLVKPLGTTDMFGCKVAYYDNILVVSDPEYNNNRGALFIYKTTIQDWYNSQPYAVLEPSGTDPVKLGSSVSLTDGLIVTGAVDAVNNGVKTGAVYLYNSNDGNWSASEENGVLYIPDADEGDQFGYSVLCYDDIIAVGSIKHNSNKGAVVMFKENVGSSNQYTKVAKLEYTQSEPEMQFGSYVVINRDIVAVACRGNNTVPSAVLFKRDGDNWDGSITEWQTVNRYNGSALTNYTSSVAFYDNILLTGNPYGDFYGDYCGVVNSYAQFLNVEATVVSGSGFIQPITDKVIYGGSITFEIAPDPGMSINEVRYNNNLVSVEYNQQSDTYTYLAENIDADVELEVSFIAGHTLNVKMSGSGAVNEERVVINDGGSHTFIFTPADYYYIGKSEFNGESVELTENGDNYEYSVHNVRTDGFFEIVFSQVMFNVNIAESVLGDISVENGDVTIGVDDKKELIITPKQGYDLAKIFVNEEEVTGFKKQSGNYVYMLSDTKTDLNIRAEFYAIEYNVVISTGDNGSASKIGNKTITIHDKTHVTITPDIGYAITKITLNSKDIINDLSRDGKDYTYILQNVIDDIHIDIEFGIVEYNMLITYTKGGDVDPAGNFITTIDNKGTMNIIPDEGYILSEINVNGSVVNEEPTFFNIIKTYVEGEYLSRLMVYVKFKSNNETGTNYDDTHKLQIKENPVSAVLRIEVPVTKELSDIIITSLSGSVVLYVSEYSDRGIDVSSIKQGVYIVTAASGNERYVGRFIKL